MIELILTAVGALVVGVAAGVILAHRRLRRAIDDTMERTDAALRRNADLQLKLVTADWSLNGRVRGPDEPPLYLMPPGQKKTNCCDDARIAWMDAAKEASDALRAAGHDGDRFYPLTVAAHQPSLGEDCPCEGCRASA